MSLLSVDRGRGLRAWIVLAGVACVLLAAGPVMAAKKSYRYEDDPIRLGMKAIEENRLEDARGQFQEAIDNEHQVYNARYGLAEILRLQANYADAEPVYREAIIEKNKETGKDEFPEARSGLGMILMRLGRFAEAKQEFEEALRQKGNLWEAQYGLARVAIQAGNMGEAKKLLDKGSRKKGLKDREDLYRFGMALVQVQEGDLPAAEKNAMAALTINPNDPDYGPLVARIFEERGAPSLAIDAYKRALETPGLLVAAPVHHSLGALYEKEAAAERTDAARRNQLYTLALEQYKEAVTQDSTFAPAIKDMARLYYLGNRNQEAMSAYLAYTHLKRDDAEGYLGFAKACLKTQRYREALEGARQAFALDSAAVETRLYLARAEFLNNGRERSRQLYGGIADSAHFEAEDYVRVGQLALQAKEYEAAERNLERALAMDSTQADAYFALGLLDLTQGRPDSAVVHYARSVALAPANSGAHLNYGIALLQLRRLPEAIAELRSATTLAPDYAPGRVYLAQALVSADSLGAALTEFKAAREREPQNPLALRGLGFCYLRRGEYGQAVGTLREATQVDPGNADGWVMLGQGQALSGNNAAARSSFQKALEINPDHENAKRGLQAVQEAQGN